MEVLDARVEEVLGNTTAGATKYVYLRALTRFIKWLYDTSDEDRRQSLFAISFCDIETINADTIAEWFARSPVVSPIDLSTLTTQECMRYLTSMEQRGVTGKSTFGIVRSAIVYLYNTTGNSRPSGFDAQMKRFFKGLHHTVTQVAQERNARLREGKEPLSFSMYRSVAKTMLKSTKKQHIFGHSFFIICWNLMCRAKSAESIRHAHLSWCEDSITITFAHMKNDQDGSRPRYPRHVYANPTIPEICPVLALGIYFAVFGFDGDGKLFPGGNQYSRFLSILKKNLECDVMKNILEQFGLTSDDFGTHSARKGAATYVSSCSTSGPSAAAICLRAGWTLPGVQNKYVRFEAAGDMIVGRYVAGLPFDSPKFATLPPFFAPLTNQTDERCELEQRLRITMDIVFPGVPPSLRMICQFGLASLLYHSSYLRAELPPNHLLFMTPLFSTSAQNQLGWLRQRIFCRNYQENDPITQSGIPPHVGIIVTLAQYKAEVDKMHQSMAESIERILQRHIHGSIMTLEALESAFEAVLARSTLSVVNEVAPTTAVAQVPATGTSLVTPQCELYMWAGSFHRVPRDFTLPSGTLRIAWQHWCAGQPPLRVLLKHDMSSRTMKVRLAELQRLMKHVESLLSNDEIQRAYGSLDSAGILFTQVVNRLPFSSSSSKGRGRRLDQLSWKTLARELKSHNIR